MNRKPAAFMSYVHSDDVDGRLSELRERLSQETRIQTGGGFEIFQDRNAILWGQNWKERIEESIDEVTFLIPIITPSFFNSPHCRDELARFLEREKELNRDDLVLPIYYVDTPLLNDEVQRASDELAQIIASRQYAEWRELRHEPFTSPQVAKTLAQLSTQIRHALERTRTPLKRRSASVRPAQQADPPTGITVQQWWSERIEGWRSVIRSFDFDKENFASTDTYSQMRQHLKPEVIEMFEAQRTLHVGNESRGDTPYRHMLLDEVARIENEWVLHTPELVKRQALSTQLSEQKKLCLHLAEELEQEDVIYKDGEESIRLWRTELEAKDLSESEIDEKLARAQDENTIGALNRYNKHLKERLLNLHDALGPQGWFGAVDRTRFENLYDPYHIRDLAKRLREVCNKLPEG